MKISTMKRIYKNLGLVEVTSDIQKKHGTIAFEDPFVFHEENNYSYRKFIKVLYTFHTTEMYRRRFIHKIFYADGGTFAYGDNYQLNPKINNNNNPWNSVIRVKIPEITEQMTRCINNIIVYRKNKLIGK